MRLIWTPYGWEDYLYWQQNDKSIMRRINELIKDVKRHPFAGIGKPEPLKFELAGKWSRRIDAEHRLVYEMINSDMVIYQCRYHYIHVKK